MRYFFHLLDSRNMRDAEADTTFTDFTGSILSSPKAARVQAATIASELAQDGDNYQGFVVVAIDERGNEIARASVIAAKEDGIE